MTPSTNTAFTNTDPSRLLRGALRVDGVSSAALGLVLVAGNDSLGGVLGLPAAVAVSAGFVLLLVGIAVAALSYRPISPDLAWATVVVNSLSVVAMLVLATTDLLPLTGSGTAFLIVGAAIVVVFADLQVLGLRRMDRAAR